MDGLKNAAADAVIPKRKAEMPEPTFPARCAMTLHETGAGVTAPCPSTEWGQER
jgi:hypothetical protein